MLFKMEFDPLGDLGLNLGNCIESAGANSTLGAEIIERISIPSVELNAIAISPELVRSPIAGLLAVPMVACQTGS